MRTNLRVTLYRARWCEMFTNTLLTGLWCPLHVRDWRSEHLSDIFSSFHVCNLIWAWEKILRPSRLFLVLIKTSALLSTEKRWTFCCTWLFSFSESSVKTLQIGCTQLSISFLCSFFSNPTLQTVPHSHYLILADIRILLLIRNGVFSRQNSFTGSACITVCSSEFCVTK